MKLLQLWALGRVKAYGISMLGETLSLGMALSSPTHPDVSPVCMSTHPAPRIPNGQRCPAQAAKKTAGGAAGTPALPAAFTECMQLLVPWALGRVGARACTAACPMWPWAGNVVLGRPTDPALVRVYRQVYPAHPGQMKAIAMAMAVAMQGPAGIPGGAVGTSALLPEPRVHATAAAGAGGGAGQHSNLRSTALSRRSGTQQSHAPCCVPCAHVNPTSTIPTGQRCPAQAVTTQVEAEATAGRAADNPALLPSPNACSCWCCGHWGG